MSRRRYVPVSEAALILGVSRWTVYRLIKADRVRWRNRAQACTEVLVADLESLLRERGSAA